MTQVHLSVNSSWWVGVKMNAILNFTTWPQRTLPNTSSLDWMSVWRLQSTEWRRCTSQLIGRPPGASMFPRPWFITSLFSPPQMGLAVMSVQIWLPLRPVIVIFLCECDLLSVVSSVQQETDHASMNPFRTNTSHWFPVVKSFVADVNPGGFSDFCWWTL